MWSLIPAYANGGRRKHWHTEEFGRVIEAIIARGDEPKAYSTYNLNEVIAPKQERKQ